MTKNLLAQNALDAAKKNSEPANPNKLSFRVRIQTILKEIPLESLTDYTSDPELKAQINNSIQGYNEGNLPKAFAFLKKMPANHDIKTFLNDIFINAEKNPTIYIKMILKNQLETSMPSFKECLQNAMGLAEGGNFERAINMLFDYEIEAKEKPIAVNMLLQWQDLADQSNSKKQTFSQRFPQNPTVPSSATPSQTTPSPSSAPRIRSHNAQLSSQSNNPQPQPRQILQNRLPLNNLQTQPRQILQNRLPLNHLQTQPRQPLQIRSPLNNPQPRRTQPLQSGSPLHPAQPPQSSPQINDIQPRPSNVVDLTNSDFQTPNLPHLNTGNSPHTLPTQFLETFREHLPKNPPLSGNQKRRQNKRVPKKRKIQSNPANNPPSNTHLQSQGLTLPGAIGTNNSIQQNLFLSHPQFQFPYQQYPFQTQGGISPVTMSTNASIQQYQHPHHIPNGLSSASPMTMASTQQNLHSAQPQLQHPYQQYNYQMPSGIPSAATATTTSTQQNLHPTQQQLQHPYQQYNYQMPSGIPSAATATTASTQQNLHPTQQQLQHPYQQYNYQMPSGIPSAAIATTASTQQNLHPTQQQLQHPYQQYNYQMPSGIPSAATATTALTQQNLPNAQPQTEPSQTPTHLPEFNFNDLRPPQTPTQLQPEPTYQTSTQFPEFDFDDFSFI